MNIDINEAISDFESLVKETPLSEDKRMKLKLNLQAIKQVVAEWEKLTDNAGSSKNS